MPAPDTIYQLVEKFRYNIHEYKSPKYLETQVRVEFINPFWEALGWDVNNRAGYAMAFRDVVHEDEIRVGGSTKAPDYSFRIGGRRIFFLEAKKPSRDLKHDPEPAFQLRRYAYSAKLPLSILTDFEELGVYDTRVKPAITDKSHVSRTLYYTFDEYIDKWDDIAGTFSKEAVMRGAFDRFVQSTKGKRGSAEIDKDFLNSLDEWRMHFVRNIALRNPGLSGRELNFAVQMTLDRLLFLRMAEDRGIETYGTLRALLNGENCYKRLVEIYYRADERYNSGLFHFEEKDGANPDVITTSLQLDDKMLKDIIRDIYYPCPYEFSQLPVEVLGNAYEQFLGKRITLTAGHRAKIEEKPEVRKAGGVYYTPQYIVDYIVEHTVGELVKDKTPGQVSKLRVLDPACGSGSFLLGAFQYLLDWHLKTYLSEYEANGKIPRSPRAKGQRARTSDPQAMFQGKEGLWFLTTTEKKRILLNNIFGVDIDANAVEVTKLSLLLKVLENENSETLHQQLGLWNERALPNLSGNIKCGNSLIGPDYYDNQQTALFDEEEMLRVNVFDWQKEFADVFAQGGFDAVIGNPPYVRIQAMKEWAPTEVEYYKKKYKSASKGNYDIYVVFVEKGLIFLNQNGLLGFILPHKFFNAKYGAPIREIIAQKKNIFHIVHFGFQQVFPGATTYTCLFFLSNTQVKTFVFDDVTNIFEWKNENKCLRGEVELTDESEVEWNFVVGKKAKVVDKLAKTPTCLGEIADIFVGIQTSADKIFIMNAIEEHDATISLNSTALGKNFEIEKTFLRPIISGTDVKRYLTPNRRQFILFPYETFEERASIVEFSKLEKLAPLMCSYLKLNKKDLERRERGKFKDRFWYRFGRNQNIGIQNRTKICVPRLVEKLHCYFDEPGTFCLDNVDVNGVSLKQEFNNISYYYLNAILNSKLMGWHFPFISAPFRGGWYSANRQFLSNLPIRLIDSEDVNDLDIQDRLVTLVQRMLNLHKTLAAARDPRTREQLQRRIDVTDHQIDRLVYELYELTEEEIKMVEEAV